MYRKLQALKEQKSQDEFGFTLIEIIVTVIIIGILAAIAIPVTLNARKTAQENDVKTYIIGTANTINLLSTRADGFYLVSLGEQGVNQEAADGDFVGSYHTIGDTFLLPQGDNGNKEEASPDFCIEITKNNITMKWTSIEQEAVKGTC